MVPETRFFQAAEGEDWRTDRRTELRWLRRAKAV